MTHFSFSWLTVLDRGSSNLFWYEKSRPSSLFQIEKLPFTCSLRSQRSQNTQQPRNPNLQLVTHPNTNRPVSELLPRYSSIGATWATSWVKADGFNIKEEVWLFSLHVVGLCGWITPCSRRNMGICTRAMLVWDKGVHLLQPRTWEFPILHNRRTPNTRQSLILS